MKSAILILTILLFATSMYAVDTSRSIVKGTRVLLFNANGFTAGSFAGGLGMKYYPCNGLALRPDLKFQYSSVTTKQAPDSYYVEPGMTEHAAYDDTKEHMTGFGFDLGVEKTLFTRGAVNVNAGAMAGFSISRYTKKSGVKYTYTQGDSTVAREGSATAMTERNSASFGINGILGVEWFITDEMSLAAEYQLGCAFSKDGTNQTTETFYDSLLPAGDRNTTRITKNPLSSSADFKLGAVGLTLGIRF